jgi:hypothetical protein
MGNAAKEKAYTDENVHFKELKDHQIDMENHMIQIIKNQRRIMDALEVKSYSQIFTLLYYLLHEPSIIYSMQDKGFILTEISDEEVEVIYKLKFNLA